MMRHRLLACGIALLWSSAAQGAQPGGAGAPPSPPRRVLHPVRLQGKAPVIDGKLDEPCWQSASFATDFTQRQPYPGAPASQRTEARVAYDDQAVYIGMRMFDTAPDSIAGQLGRRDLTGVYSDWVHVMIDSYHDRRTAFRFSLNPEGVQKDVLHYDDVNEDITWDAVWESAALKDSLGWTAEMRIPLSQLRFSTKGGTATDSSGAKVMVWGLGLGRDIARSNERADWSPIPPDAAGYVSLFGDLNGLSLSRPPRQLEVLPYSLGRLTQAPGTTEDPFFDPHETAGKAGLDFKYGVTSSFVANGAVNPDFGEVEADPSVFNLGTSETFYPEKRPFFVEGNSIYRYDISFDDNAGEQLFYSRRVGRIPQGSPGADAQYADMPDVTTILGAAKLTGKTSGGWSMGVLEGVTQKEDAKVVTTTGEKREDVVEPLTNYAVVRGIKDFHDGQSAIGGIFTATNRQIEPNVDFLRAGAYSGGIDWRHRFWSGNYEVTGWAASSFLEGSAQSIDEVQRSSVHNFQRPDAGYLHYDPTRTSLAGGGGHLWFSKRGGGHWRGGLGGHVRSPGFEINDLGFQTSADEVLTFGNLRWEEFRPTRHFRRWSVGVNPSASWNFNNELLWSGINLNTNFDLTSNGGGFAGARRSSAGLSMTELRGGPAIATNNATSWWSGVWSDTRKKFWAELDADGWNEDGTDSHTLTTSLAMYIRPSGRMDLSLTPRVQWNDVTWQYVDQPAAAGTTHYVYGSLDQTTTSVTARLSFAFTRKLSLQYYGQPFITAGRYFDFKEVADPRAKHFGDRFRNYAPNEISYDAANGTYNIDTNGDAVPDYDFANPDFNFKQFRSTLVARWDYRPGSALYVVWGNDRTAFDPDGSFDLGADTKALFEADGSNVFIVKVNYWLNL